MNSSSRSQPVIAGGSEPSAAFTPGPWYVDQRQGRLEGYSAISAAGWIAFAEVVTRLSHEDEDSPKGVANARLIAAAPDLYANLQHMTALVRLEYGNLDADVNVFIDAALAALAKAEGK